MVKSSDMTELESRLHTFLLKKRAFPNINFARDTQQLIDDLTPEFMTQIPQWMLTENNKKVYDDTAQEYAAAPQHKGVIEEALHFLDMIPSDGSVLDVGCGHGRDTYFFHSNHIIDRASLMQREYHGQRLINKYKVPTKVLRATGIDTSQKMIELAKSIGNTQQKMGFCLESDLPKFRHIKSVFEENIELEWYDGIWSCASLFTHTPFGELDDTMVFVSRRLKPGGTLFLSYTTRTQRADSYHKLLLSSTGRIKYFSHQYIDDITELAAKHGLKLHSQNKQGLFASQFFTKEK